jgi:dCMP deaminase
LKPKFQNMYMEIAETVSKMSYAKRLQVGAIVVKDNRIISIGYNGSPAGWDNNCEDENNKTKPEVIHAEANAIMKLARSNESGMDSVMFLTHAPCIDCAKLIYGSGITQVFYKNEYRDQSGVEFLKKCNLIVNQL